jgi:hypothetical protein
LKTATLLAFRLHERDRCDPGSRRDFYEREVARLRQEVRGLLAGSA